MLVLLFLDGLHGIEHDYALETAEVDRKLLMRQLHFLDDGLDLLQSHFLAHASETRREIRHCQHVYVLMVEVLVQRVQQ